MSAIEKSIRVLQNRKEETEREIEEAKDSCIQQLTSEPIRITGFVAEHGGGLLTINLQAAMRLEFPVLEICPGLALSAKMGSTKVTLQLSGLIGLTPDGKRTFSKNWRVVSMEPADADRFARPLLEAAGLVADDDYLRLLALAGESGKPGLRDFDLFYPHSIRRLSGQCPVCSYAENGGRWFVHKDPCSCKEAGHVAQKH